MRTHQKLSYQVENTGQTSYSLDDALIYIHFDAFYTICFYGIHYLTPVKYPLPIIKQSYEQLLRKCLTGVEEMTTSSSIRGVKLFFTMDHISLMVAFKGQKVILGLYKYNYSHIYTVLKLDLVLQRQLQG